MPKIIEYFAWILVLNIALTFRSSDYWKSLCGGRSDTSLVEGENNKEAVAAKKVWSSLIRKYLAVYLLAALSDWLQGPYVYALYAEYGYSQHSIAVLFVAGFGSSMIFGSFVGGMADWGGRRAFVIIFTITYALSCITKHFQNFQMLMLGRLLGGVATSLLFSVFDAWLIRAHADANIKHLLGKSFSWASYGNSVIAILAGLIANKAASDNKMSHLDESLEIHVGGFLNPFDIALAVLLVCGGLAIMLWEENYGDTDGSAENSKENRQWYDGLRSAFTTTIRSTDILLCGIISALFEGSMYIFVFMWTPALSSVSSVARLAFGVIFSTFMVSCMAGSSLFSILSEYMKGEKMAVLAFAVAACSMVLMITTTTMDLRFMAMNLFEMAVGMYWPIMGTMKGSIVPESKRAAIYNLYRIPLNFIVLFSLLTDLTPAQSFSLNFVMLSTATVLQIILMKRREKNGMSSTTAQSDSNESEAKNGDDESLLASYHIEII